MFLVRGSAGSSVKLSFRAGARKGVGKSCPPWPLGCSLCALPFLCLLHHSAPFPRERGALAACLWLLSPLGPRQAKKMGLGGWPG